MKETLLDILICPACLPEEQPLHYTGKRVEGGDLAEGWLRCPACGGRYRIMEGVAAVLPDLKAAEAAGAGAKYESAPVLTAYLWSHYADLFEDAPEPSAYADWASLLDPCEGIFLDAGCAVGRLSFEMSGRFDRVVGVDLSRAFVKTARELMAAREVSFTLPTEGLLGRTQRLRLPGEWRPEKVDFLVADVQRLPFRRDLFAGLASLNLVDKVPKPLLHLREMDRVARNCGAQFLFSDPFSWSPETAHPADWLGGTLQGPFAGRGLDNVKALLEGRGRYLAPWRIDRTQAVWWSIRNHDNYFERIRSLTVKAVR